MDPLSFYQQHITSNSKSLKKVKSYRNLITLSKLLVFGAIIFLIYLWIVKSTLPLVFLSLLSILAFLLLTIADVRILSHQRLLEEQIQNYKNEIAYLQGNLSPFSTGRMYEDTDHPYATDLDIFGENSLFQHLDRTVTAPGKEKLADWLLVLSQNPATIIQRQQATRELANQPVWLHYFRALGKLHPTQQLDSSFFRSWQKESLFFLHPGKIRIFLYTANTLTIAGWLVAITGLLPWSLAFCLSALQLIILTIYLKKINAYHVRLNTFLKTISNYLPLVKAIRQPFFHSPSMQRIQDQLFAPKNGNSLKAFSRLYRIQNALDQRGNILIALILNGLYLKDFHILLCLDQWKKTYAAYIDNWLEAISHTDVLISMAIYRFNHPQYTEPLISTSVLLDAEAIGHPLLKGKWNVTNNFKIDTLHQIYIVTGANMAGKSTFLRTIGVNLVLAQSGNVVLSSRFTFQPMALFTSMRTIDNLAKNTSYFHAELLRLKQLISLAEQEERLFIILDEMLKGTNSVDKLNGSLAFLRKLLHYPVSGLVATHDLALGELSTMVPSHFFNVCFEITHSGTDILYDYKLHQGVSNTMNASILLKQMGLI